MAKANPLQSNFNAGEFSPYMQGRVDADRYKAALKTCLNYVPTIQGGMTRRSATAFVFPTKDNGVARLQSFEFSTTQAYMIEFGDQYIRFYKDNGIITNAAVNISAITQANPAVVTSNAHGFTNGKRIVINSVKGMTELDNREFIVANVTANTFELQGVNSTGYHAYISGGTAAEIYEISSTYLLADLFQLKVTQSADVLYIVHPTYPPRKLTRTAHNNWTLTNITFLDGPYFNTNTTSTTLTPSAATGTGITITASSIVGINGGTGFQSTDVGRVIRMKEGSVWGYARITGFTSTTVVTADVVNTLTNTSAKTSWRLGLWSGTSGYPGAVTFHEDRLFFAGSTGAPQRLDGSQSGDYENFAPTETDGTVKANNSVGFSLNSNDVNLIRWMTSDEKGLLAGSVGGEWVIRAASINEALSPTNISAKRATSWGSENVQAVLSGKASLFVQRGGRNLREMNYYYDVDGFRASDLTQLADHIINPGVVQIAYQRIPQSIVWCARTDGVVSGMTYDRDLDAVKVGWHRHILGGTSDSAGTHAIVESVQVLPSPDGTLQEVWFVVKRYVNGQTKRYVEYLTKFFEDSDLQRDAFFVDSGLTYDAPITITGATQANPVVITAPSHGLSNGNTVLINDISGMEELNGNSYTLANVTTNTFELLGIDGTSYGAYISGGQVRKYVTQIEGLNHLEGETVAILADGAVQPSEVVTGGRVNLSTKACTVSLGYTYNSDAELLRLEAGAQFGTALGKIRRTNRVSMLLHRTLGLKIGYDPNELDTITFRTTSDPMTRAPALYSGVLLEEVVSDYNFENNFYWRQDQPLPGTILAVMPEMKTEDT